jgi:hypothetical protein
MEFFVGKALLDHLFPTTKALGLIILLFIGFLCATYTSVGGFVGILRTDFFQLWVIVIGCILMLVNAPVNIGNILASTKNYIFFKEMDFSVFITCIMFGVMYHFSSPDLWIRNVGTLRENNKPTIKPLIWGGIGILIILIPFCLFSLNILAKKQLLVQSLDIILLTNTIANYLTDTHFVELNFVTIWWLIGGGICIFITSVDTWLIGILQHHIFFVKTYEHKDISLYPYWIIFVSILVAISINYDIFIVIGLYGSLLAHFNTIVIISSIIKIKKSIDMKRVFKIYFAVGAIFTLIETIFYWPNLESYIQHVIITHSFLSLAVLIFIKDYSKNN